MKMISLNFARQNLLFQTNCSRIMCRLASTQVSVNTTEVNPLMDEWQVAKPFESVPRPSVFQFLRAHLPGGRFYGNPTNEIYGLMREEHGDIFINPGLFGKNDIVLTYNPEDFRKVFRTEGIHPIRRGFELIGHYRETYQPEVFKESKGLVSVHGTEWAKIRTAVNPVLMNPKTFKHYTPKLDRIADQFVQRIKNIRSSQNSEVPEDFGMELKYITLESAGIVALDTHFGLIDQSVSDDEVKRFVNHLPEFFELVNELDLKPSVWKLVATPNYKKFIANMDILTNMAKHFVEEAKERCEANEAKNITKPELEQSILERLIKINPSIATVMAIDTILAGVDTTTTAFASCLISIASNPEKQKKLRNEILGILPDKDTPFATDKLLHLPYLRACIKESLRLNPVTITNFRTTGQDVVLSGYRIPKDVDVIMVHDVLFRDEKNYIKANEFLPERWLRDDSSKDENGCPLRSHNPFVFLPFGFGPRICIGKRIVDLQLEIFLAKLVRNFEIRFDYPTHDVFKAHIFNVPVKALKFKFVDLKN